MYPRMWALCPPVSTDRSPSSSLGTYSHLSHTDSKPVRSPVATPLLQHHLLRNTNSVGSNESVCFVCEKSHEKKKHINKSCYIQKQRLQNIRNDQLLFWISSNCSSEPVGRPWTASVWPRRLKDSRADGHPKEGWKHQFCLLLFSNDLLWEASQTAKRRCNIKTTTVQTRGPPLTLPACWTSWSLLF